MNPIIVAQMARASSIVPLPSATQLMACRPVAQACCTSNAGVYASSAEVRSCTKPSSMPQFRIYATAALYSAAVTRRARRPVM